MADSETIRKAMKANWDFLTKDYGAAPAPGSPDYWGAHGREHPNDSRFQYGYSHGLSGLAPTIAYTGLKAAAQAENPIISGIGKRLIAAGGPSAELIYNALKGPASRDYAISMLPRTIADIPAAMLSGKSSYDDRYTVDETSYPASPEDIAAYIRGAMKLRENKALIDAEP